MHSKKYNNQSESQSLDSRHETTVTNVRSMDTPSIEPPKVAECVQRAPGEFLHFTPAASRSNSQASSPEASGEVSAKCKGGSQTRKVAGAQYLFTRSGVYYFKRKIPVDARGAFPEHAGQQIWRSLDTELLHVAQVRLRAEISLFDETVARFRRQSALVQLTGLGAVMSPQANNRHGQLQTAQVEQEQGGADEKPLSPGWNKVTSARASAAWDPSAIFNQLKTLTHAVEQILAANHLGSLTQTQPGSLLESSKSAQAPIPISVAHQNATPPTKPVSSPSSVTLYLLLEDWKLTQTRPRTITTVENALEEFARCAGVVVVEQLTRNHARKYRDLLIEKGLSKSTIENRLGFLATLFRHGQKELIEHLHINPFEHIEIRAQPIRPPKNRRAFENSELSRIVHSSLYRQGHVVKGQVAEAAYWLPLLGMFTGARLEEICQLYLSDIQLINGVYAIRFANLEEGQKLKTQSSFRRVPIHKQLVACGFLKHVEQMKALGHDRVFPSLSNANSHGTFSNAAGKWFARFLDSITLTDSRLDFHSFRYTFKQQCTLQGIPNEVRDALTGHWSSAGDASRVYMRAEDRQYPFPALVHAIEQFAYPELDFSLLYIRQL